MEVWEIHRGRGSKPHALRIVVMSRVSDGALWAKVVRGDARNGHFEILRAERPVSQRTLERWAEELDSGKWTLSQEEVVARMHAAKRKS